MVARSNQKVRAVRVAGGGRTSVLDHPGPPGAPALVLLHGWGATADVNWGACFEPLSRHFRVIALDHRGHGNGLATERFALEQCADDAVEIARARGCESFIAVGWSMGGPIATLAWRRHPHNVRGLVLCATGRHLLPRSAARIALPAVRGLARVAPSMAVAGLIQRSVVKAAAKSDKARFRREYAKHDARALVGAAEALGRFSSHDWISEVDVPTACVVTMKDGLVPADRQRRLARSIPGAEVFEVDGNHSVCVSDPEAFVPKLTSACLRVAERHDEQPRLSQAG